MREVTETVEDVVVTVTVVTNKTTNKFSGGLAYYGATDNLIAAMLDFIYQTTGELYFVTSDENDGN